MERLSLNSQIRLCDLHGGIALLDLQKQKYLVVPGASTNDIHHCLSPAALPSSRPNAEPWGHREQLTSFLLSQGVFLRSGDTSGGIGVHGRYPDDPRITAADITHFLYALSWAYMKLKRSSISVIVRRLSDLRESLANGAAGLRGQDLRRKVFTYVRLRAWAYTAVDACLLDSLALVRFLAFYDTSALWVIGVTGRPFGAHCWVECDRLVLNDSLDHVQLFTPILVA